MPPTPPPRQPAPETAEDWTTRRLLAWMGDRFRERHLDSPRLSAEMLLSHVLDCERLTLYTDADRPASQPERDRLRELVGRALRHEPIQYLVGEAWFFGLPLRVTPAVLIPRPSTESLVEAVLQWLRPEEVHHGEHGEHGDEEEGVCLAPKRSGGDSETEAPPPKRLHIADIGTGSGAIAVAIARNKPEARLVATDISPQALSLARENAERHGVADRVEFREGDLFAPFAADERFDLIVSNPPYIPDHEWDAVPPNVREHEPTLALRAGAAGLDVIEPLLRSAPAHLKPGGLLLIEHAAAHAAEVRQLAEATGQLVRVKTLADLEGHPRLLYAERT